MKSILSIFLFFLLLSCQSNTGNGNITIGPHLANEKGLQKLIDSSLSKNAQALSDLLRIPFYDTISRNELGSVITQVVHRVGENDILDMISAFTNDQKADLRDLLEKGLQYGPALEEGVHNLPVEKQFPLLGKVLAAYRKNCFLYCHVKGLKNDSVVIFKFSDDPTMYSIPVANGSFVLRDSLKEPVFINILSQYRKMAELLLEPGVCWVTGSSPHYDSVHVTGLRSDSVIKSYLAADESLLDKAWRLKREADSLHKIKEDERANQLLGEARLAAKEDRLKLIKQYVSHNRSDVAGALLLNFCTVGEVLKKQDYREMYDMLSPAVQQTLYGRSVLERAGGNQK